MYESFYHLQTNPFSLVPDPHFCFNHAGHQQAREYLEYALKLGEGMVMVTGHPGTGKTTLVESFLHNLNMGSVTAARLAVSRLDSNDLLRAVAYTFDIEAEGHDKATLRHMISHYLETQLQYGRRVLLIIDEAQGLPRSALDELRLLADLQVDSRQMLQLFLVGQEQLHDQMLDPEMDYFQQRVIANYRLVPLDLQETRSYIEYRLRQAGWQGDPELTGAAVLDIFRFSKGVPRHINKLCNRLLLLGYGIGSHTLDREQVQTIIKEMGEEQLGPVATQQSIPEAAAAILDESALQQELLAELAIKVDKPVPARRVVPIASATVDDRPEADRLAGGHLDGLPETGDLPMPAAALLRPVRIQDRRVVVISRWRNRLASSLVVVTVAVLTFVAITSIVDNDVAQQLAMIEKVPQHNLLQRVLNDELPATAGGSLLTVATATTLQTDSPLQAVRSFVTQTEYANYLLGQGHKALLDNRLLKPALHSAYYYFQGALRVMPDNRDAARGIEKIVERYVVLTNQALQERDRIMANRYIARGLSIQPGNSALLVLKERSHAVVSEPATEALPQASGQTFAAFLTRVKLFFMNVGRSPKDAQASYQVTSSFLYE